MAAVAKRAGVHVTTVSAALRNHPSLPLSTRQRLQALAKEMGYQPDPALASLVAYRSRNRPAKNKVTLAYVTNWGSQWGWKEAPAHVAFFAGAESKAADLGYQLEHFWIGEPGLSARRMSDIINARGIPGIILASHRQELDGPIDFDWSRFSAVKIDFFPHQPAVHNVTNDQRAIMRLAVRRVIEAGYRRVGCVMPREWDSFVDRAWSAGFLAEQQDFPEADRIPILFTSYANGNPLVSAEAFSKWHQRHRPEVLISSVSFVLPRLQQMGLQVPRDIAFVDIFLEQQDGTIAGVRQNCRRVGEVAVEILVSQLHQHVLGPPAFATSTLVEGTWVDGKSLPRRVTASVELASA